MQPSAQYEAFIAELVRVLLLNRGASDVRFGPQNHLTGASAAKHQVDVSFIDKETSPHRLVVIECKYLGKRIGLGHVKVLKATIDDLAEKMGSEVVVKGVLVSLRVAQSGAITYAKHCGIDLQIVPDRSACRFKYADLELVAAKAEGFGRSKASGHGVALCACKLCSLTFQGDGASQVCQSCSAAK